LTISDMLLDCLYPCRGMNHSHELEGYHSLTLQSVFSEFFT